MTNLNMTKKPRYETTSKLQMCMKNMLVTEQEGHILTVFCIYTSFSLKNKRGLGSSGNSSERPQDLGNFKEDVRGRVAGLGLEEVLWPAQHQVLCWLTECRVLLPVLWDDPYKILTT